MDDYTMELNSIKNEIEIMTSRIFSLSMLVEKMRQNEDFTQEEIYSIEKKLEESKEYVSKKQEILDTKHNIYFNKIKIIKDSLKNRQKIIDECIKDASFYVDDICEIFIPLQSSLKTELEKYILQINQTT